jgi:hypothetical protein
MSLVAHAGVAAAYCTALQEVAAIQCGWQALTIQLKVVDLHQQPIEHQVASATPNGLLVALHFFPEVLSHLLPRQG